MTEKKVVVTETIDNHGLELLKRETEVVYLPQLPGRTLSEEIKEAYAVAVRVTKLAETSWSKLRICWLLPSTALVMTILMWKRRPENE